MKDLICINAKFSKNQLDFYEKHGVITPEQDKIYNCRDVIINSSGENGILLEEIVNPKVPIKHPIMGKANIEPNWDVNRFRTLSGDNVDAIALARELKKVNV